MAAYLKTNPPAVSQYRSRRGTPTGLIGVHTPEWRVDATPPDLTAEAVAAFIARRSDHGSYHTVVDSDSTVQLVDWADTAYQIRGSLSSGQATNDAAMGLAFAGEAAKWGSYPDWWVSAVLVRGADAAADYAAWLFDCHGVSVPAVRITKADALAGRPGFVAHADMDPGRRVDPGDGFPWDQFLGLFAKSGGGSPPPPVVSGMNARQVSAVIAIQDRLVEMGAAIVVDGDPGPLTVKALVEVTETCAVDAAVVDAVAEALTTRT